MRLIDQLATLQEIDSELDADRKRYAEIQTELHPPTSLLQAQTDYSKIADKIEHWRKERKQREAAVADQSAKISAQEKKLYSGNIKDSREQIALQQNVEALKRHLATLEESELEAILEQEQGEGELAEAGKKLETEKAVWAKQELFLQKERDSLIVHAKKLKVRRDAAAAELAPPALQRYEALRQKLGGVAVAHLRGTSCGGCGAALPTAMQQQTHGSELISCPSCGRLLVDR